jgi:two-component system chemotaxis response regulator CheB
MNQKVKVLVVDDSAFIRVLLTEMLTSDKRIEVIATAEDPIDAREKIKKYSPDVLTLDVEMPKMDGLTFLRNIMRLRPMPVVMVSTLTQKGADTTIQALEIGAFDFISKPKIDVKNQFRELAGELIEKVIAAARCNIHALEDSTKAPEKILSLAGKADKLKLIAIGASTGGTEAIRNVLSALPLGLPPIMLTQHIPEMFSGSYARRLNRECKIKVREVLASTRLEHGCAYLAPGSHHMRVELKDDRYWATLDNGDKVNRHKPAVDVLFTSVAKLGISRSLAVLLTGMGKDGSQGMLRMKKVGATTVVQDEVSSVVWGMPGSAVALGAVDEILPLNQIAQYICDNR